MFNGDIHQMGLKNRRFLDEFFSFHANAMSLIFFVKKIMSRYVAPQSPFFKILTFLREKGRESFHDSQSGYRVT